MGANKCLTAIGLALMISFSVMPFGSCAKETDKGDNAAPGNYSDGYLAQRLGAMQKSTELAGARILGRDDVLLGKITDLLVGLHAGKIYCALASPGDADSTVAVPGQSFLPAGKSRLTLDVDKEMLKGAPRFSTADWKFAALCKFIGESYSYFNQKPLWDDKAGLGQINKGRDFIGSDVKDKDNQRLGKVMNLMVDLPTARIVFVVISFDGSEKSLYAVPPEALRLNPDSKDLFLDESKAKIEARAHPDNFFWAEMTDKAWAAKTYRTYGIEPDFDANCAKADPAREAVRAKVEDGPVRIKAAGNSDSEITRKVLVEMLRQDMSNAFDHKNIHINTVNGRVTLSGRLKKDKQKSRLGEIAESVVGPGNVDNQLEIR